MDEPLGLAWLRVILRNLLFRAICVVISLQYLGLFTRNYCGMISQLSRKVALGRGFTVYKLKVCNV